MAVERAFSGTRTQGDAKYWRDVACALAEDLTILDVDHRVLFTNATFPGQSMNEPPNGALIYDLIKPRYALELRDAVENALATGAATTLEMDSGDSPSQPEWFSYRVSGVYADGEITGVAITANRVRHATIEDARRLPAPVRAFASGAAYHLNNLLTPISTTLELLQLSNNTASHAESLEEIRTSLRRAADFLDQLEVIGQSVDQSQKEVVNVMDVLEVVAAQLRSSHGVVFEYTQSAPGEDCNVLGDGQQLIAAITHVADNGARAIRRGGTLSATVESVWLDKAAARKARVRQGRYVRVRITDTGPGISARALPHVFEPFFSNQSHGARAGLGLPTADGIVAQHGGGLEVATAPGCGTTFTVHLPLHHQGQEEAASVRQVASSTRALPQHLMIVDDDPSTLRSTGRWMRRQGVTVSLFSSPTTAFETFLKDPARYDAVLTDQRMPKMSGAALAKSMLLVKPNLRLIIATGLVDSDVREVADVFGAAVVAKPWDAETMLRALRGSSRSGNGAPSGARSVARGDGTPSSR